MSINKNGKNVKPISSELKPELISWDEPISESENTAKTNLKDKYYPYLVLLGGILSAGSFFFLGRISGNEAVAEPIAVNYINEALNPNDLTKSVEPSTKESKNTTEPIKQSQVLVPTPNTNGEVIGSKSGKKYYFPWCGTVKRIKPENQVHFVSIAAAKASGFTPGGNCKGIY